MLGVCGDTHKPLAERCAVGVLPRERESRCHPTASRSGVRFWLLFVIMLESVLELSGYHTAQLPRESLFYGTGKETLTDC